MFESSGSNSTHLPRYDLGSKGSVASSSASIMSEMANISRNQTRLQLSPILDRALIIHGRTTTDMDHLLCAGGCLCCTGTQCSALTPSTFVKQLLALIQQSAKKCLQGTEAGVDELLNAIFSTIIISSRCST